MSQMQLSIAAEHIQAQINEMYMTMVKESGMESLPFLLIHCKKDLMPQLGMTPPPESEEEKHLYLLLSKKIAKNKEAIIAGVAFEAWVKEYEKDSAESHIPGSLSKENNSGECIMMIVQDKETNEYAVSVGHIVEKNEVKLIYKWEDMPANSAAGTFVDFQFFD